MKTYLAICASAVALASSPALAQDGQPSFYFGAIAGADKVTLENDDYGAKGSEDGIAYGLVGGVELKSTSVVVGAELEYSDADTDYSESDLLEVGDNATISAGRDLYAGVRAGYLVTPALNIYGKIGYTNAKVKGSYTDSTGTYSGSDEIDGYRIGAGLEYDLGMVRLRGEYRYSDYGNYGADLIDGGIDVSRSQFVAGVVFGF